MEVGEHVGLVERELAVEPEEPRQAFVFHRIYPDEIEIFGFVDEELPEALAAHKDEAMPGVGIA